MNHSMLQQAGVPYLSEWFGYWAMHVPTLMSLHSRLTGMDLNAHLSVVASRRQSAIAMAGGSPTQASDNAKPPVSNQLTAKAEAIRQQVPRGYSYDCIDGIAFFEASGTLMKQESSVDDSTSTAMLRNSVRKMRTDPLVRAVIGVWSSPGGTVSGMYDLVDDLAMLAKEKPVFSYAKDICCSAAYAGACHSRAISANRNALVGSIGTYGVVWDMSKMYAEAGVKVHVIAAEVDGRRSPYKGAGEPGTEITEAQLGMWQEQTNALNDLFIDTVMKGRNFDRAKVVGMADANTHVAAKAKKLGFIDKIETLDELFNRVRKEIGAGAGGPVILQGVGSVNVNDVLNEKFASKIVPPMQTETDPAAETADRESTPEAAAGDVPPSDGAEGQQTEGETSEKGSDMSQTTTTAPANPAPEQPKAATAAEIKAACPGASSDFVLDCVENAKTLAQSKDAFIGWQRAQITSRDESLTKLAADHKSAIEAKDATIKTLTEERDAARATAKNAGGLVPTGSTEQAKQPTSGDDTLDPKAQAKQEWESNHNNCRAGFINEKVYTGYRTAELAGRIKSKK